MYSIEPDSQCYCCGNWTWMTGTPPFPYSDQLCDTCLIDIEQAVWGRIFAQDPHRPSSSGARG